MRPRLVASENGTLELERRELKNETAKRRRERRRPNHVQVGRPKCIEQKFAKAKRGIFLPGSCRFRCLAPRRFRRLVLSSRRSY
jgi:hypothetical protein